MISIIMDRPKNKAINKAKILMATYYYLTTPTKVLYSMIVSIRSSMMQVWQKITKIAPNYTSHKKA